MLDLIPVLDGISRTDLESIAPPMSERLRLLPAPLDIERTEFTRDLLERDVLEDDRATLIDELLLAVRRGQQIQIGHEQGEYLELLLKKEKVKQILAVLARRTVQSLRRNYHYVVVDTPTQLDDMTMTTLELSDLVLLVCTPDVPSIRATRAAMTLLGELGIRRESMAFVLNRSGRRAEISSTDIRSLFNGYEQLGELPADFRGLQPFINNGSLIAQSGANTALVRALNKFAAQVIERVPIARAA
ncbi:hypothetical protein HC891_02175 [Candidatus Gracilibacteria bacterium]|nr:hypothetical protein [Candidatus Gracilibacteria bacterium]